ncbi:MAG: hypothetical protein QM704_21410 [Anaeromyxobacteraceae bacterium]
MHEVVQVTGSQAVPVHSVHTPAKHFEFVPHTVPSRRTARRSRQLEEPSAAHTFWPRWHRFASGTQTVPSAQIGLHTPDLHVAPGPQGLPSSALPVWTQVVPPVQSRRPVLQTFSAPSGWQNRSLMQVEPDCWTSRSPATETSPPGASATFEAMAGSYPVREAVTW